MDPRGGRGGGSGYLEMRPRSGRNLEIRDLRPRSGRKFGNRPRSVQKFGNIGCILLWKSINFGAAGAKIFGGIFVEGDLWDPRGVGGLPRNLEMGTSVSSKFGNNPPMVV